MNTDHYRAQVQVDKLIWKVCYGFLYKTNPSKAAQVRDKRAPEIEEDVIEAINEMLKSEQGRFLFKVFLTDTENIDPWSVEEISGVLGKRGVNLG